MPIVPRASVRANLAVAILLTILLSWVLSTGIANYLNYLGMRSLHQEMLNHPELYPQPIPEPRFGVLDLLIGRPPAAPLPPRSLRPPPYAREPGFRPPPGALNPAMGPGRPPMGPPNERTERRPPWPDLRWLLPRLGIALGLAVLVGTWLGRKFTRPLTQLADGAEAFHSGDFAHRIPADGDNEFAAVATAMNEMARQVSDHINRLEDDAERRRQFLADIAHELRSPVTTLRTMAGALQDGVAEEPERRNRAVAALVQTSERLLRLVRDLMELAKLDLNELPLNVKQVDLRELAGLAVQSHEAEAVAGGVTLHAPDPGPPVQATVDPDRITQVLDNILDNAISHAGAGALVSTVIQEADDIRISIRDTGCGISASDLPHILDPFYRADTARTPTDCHAGLGLSIACRLVEAHEGRLTISSEEGTGTTVEILLPRTHRK